MMQLKQVVSILLFSFVAFCAKAQDANADTLLRPAIVFSGPDSLIYSVQRGEQLFGDSVIGSLAVEGLFPEEQLFEVRILENPMTYLRTRIQLDTAWTPYVRIDTLGARYTLTLSNPEEQPKDYTRPNVAHQSELEVQVFTVNNENCAPPALPSQVTDWIAELEAMEFERQREPFLRSVLTEQCLTIQQSRRLISTVDDEEKRLALLLAGYNSSFEKDDYHKLNDLLYLERSQTDFLNWLLQR